MPQDNPRYKLKLYVIDAKSRSKVVIEQVKKILQEAIESGWDLEVIDILERPQLAEEERIIAVPTLIKYLPAPLARLVGNLSDREKVLLGLDVSPDPREH